MKTLFFCFCLIFACLVASIYGALHNQLSYTVSLDYFHAFKFIQFGLDPELQTRVGASLVGLMASWWMGIVLGLPIALISLFLPNPVLQRDVFLTALSIVIFVAAIIGLSALSLAIVTPTDATPILGLNFEPIADPVAFRLAGTLHNFSYLGAGLGLMIALGYTIAIVMRQMPGSKQSNGHGHRPSRHDYNEILSRMG